MTRKPVRCKAISKQTGQRCKLNESKAAPGSGVCRYHGALAPQVIAAAKRRLEAAEAIGEAAKLGLRIDVTDGELLVAMRAEAAGNVTVYRAMVQQLPDLYGPLYHSTGYETGEAKRHIVVALYEEAIDRAAKLDAICVKLGLAERQVRIGEAQADRLYTALQRALTSLKPLERATVERALAEQLRKLGDAT